MSVTIREIAESDRSWVRNLLRAHWASERIVTRGRVHQGDRLPGFVALDKGEHVGLVTYHIENDACEIVSLDSLRERQGIGSALIKSVCEAAARGCRKVWLITTNDNTPAMRFYERRGFSLVAVHRNAIEISRKIKPEIPLVGVGGVPIRDEIEYELPLRV